MSDSSLDVARRLLDGFGSTLRRTRKVYSFTVRDLAEETEIRSDVINRIETGKWIPTQDEEQILREWMLQHVLPPQDD